MNTGWSQHDVYRHILIDVLALICVGYQLGYQRLTFWSQFVGFSAQDIDLHVILPYLKDW